jgi:rSAM/selenodomain-associated transferase 1
MKTAIGVMAQAPLPGRCKTRLLAAHPPEWVAGLYAAMLRDTLDGLQSVNADDYVVFVAPLPPAPAGAEADGEEPDEDARTTLAFEVLARHVPAPWRLVAQRGADLGERVEHAFSVMFEGGASYALLSGSDAPSVPTEPLAEAFAAEATRSQVLIGPSEDGGYYAIGMARIEPRLVRDIPWSTPAVTETTRLRCKELSLDLHELPKWYGVDEPSDVLRLLDELRANPERAPRTAQFLVKNG